MGKDAKFCPILQHAWIQKYGVEIVEDPLDDDNWMPCDEYQCRDSCAWYNNNAGTCGLIEELHALRCHISMEQSLGEWLVDAASKIADALDNLAAAIGKRK